MEEPPPPAQTFSIELNQRDAESLEEALPLLMEREPFTRNEALTEALMIGITIMRRNAETEIDEKHIVAECIQKLKANVHVTPEELNAVAEAARNGDLAAQIIVTDFKRFGRSIAKD